MSATGLLALPVSAWVPAYDIPACKTILQKDFGGVGMKDVLTYLPLQFYLCSGPKLVKVSNTSDADIAWFINWGHLNNVKVLLCMFDYIGGDWNWPEAVKSFKDNRDAYISAVVTEIDRLDFDGADIDFEPNVATVSNADRDAYYVFADSLAARLHAKGKVLTAAVFPGNWGAPQASWYPTIFKSCDALGSMGYERSGLAVDYAQQVSSASTAPNKFMIGMPGRLNIWQGNTVNEQVDWVINNGTVGLCIWTANISGSQWQTAGLLNKIKAIRQKGATALRNPPAGLTRNTGSIEVHQAPGRGVRFSIGLAEQEHTSVTLFDTRGRRIAKLFDGRPPIGALCLNWNGLDGKGIRVPQGSYVVAVQTGAGQTSRQFLLVR
jgi:hypothetical protein